MTNEQRQEENSEQAFYGKSIPGRRKASAKALRHDHCTQLRASKEVTEFGVRASTFGHYTPYNGISLLLETCVNSQELLDFLADVPHSNGEVPPHKPTPARRVTGTPGAHSLTGTSTCGACLCSDRSRGRAFACLLLTEARLPISGSTGL